VKKSDSFLYKSPDVTQFLINSQENAPIILIVFFPTYRYYVEM